MSTEVTADMDLDSQQGIRGDIARAVIAVVSDDSTEVNVLEIAKRAGISRPTFYKYFPTLGAAMLHVHNLVIHEIDMLATDGEMSDATGLDRIFERLSRLKALIHTRPDLLRFSCYFDYTFRNHGFTEDEQRSLQSHDLMATSRSLEIFIEGQKDGSIRADLDPKQTVAALGASALGMLQRALVALDSGGQNKSMVVSLYDTNVEVWRSFLSPADCAEPAV